jgi:hypothetical protein
MRTYALGAQELTRRLVARVASENGAAGDSALASRTACERACRDLGRSLGAAGFNALLTRALAQAEAEHPLLAGVRIGRAGEPVLGGLDELIAQNGAPAVDAGLECMLATMLGLLGRLIGDDMVPRLLEHETPDQMHDHKDAK